MRDQRGLPRPGVGLPFGDPVRHHLGRCLKTDDEHAINRDRVDDTLQFALGLCRCGDQEQVPTGVSL